MKAFEKSAETFRFFFPSSRSVEAQISGPRFDECAMKNKVGSENPLKTPLLTPRVKILRSRLDYSNSN